MIFFYLACVSQSDVHYDKYNGGSFEGSIEGRSCDPERGVWLEGATVYTNIINSQGDFLDTIQTTTDEEGRWKLEDLLTKTSYTVYVQKGSKGIDLFNVDMETDPITLPDPECGASKSESPVAVVTGDYDDLPTVLSDLSVEVHEVNGRGGDEALAFLLDAANLENFDTLLLAGGTEEEDIYYDTDQSDSAGNVALVQASIQAFVEGGGTLWATDWTYDIIEQIWPGKADFVGDDAIPNSAQVGTPGALDAHVDDADLKAELGKASIQVNYQNDTWPVVESVDAGVTVLESADAPYRIGMETFTQPDSPLAFTFKAGKGRVIYTSWMVDENVGKAKAGILYLLGL